MPTDPGRCSATFMDSRDSSAGGSIESLYVCERSILHNGEHSGRLLATRFVEDWNYVRVSAGTSAELERDSCDE